MQHFLPTGLARYVSPLVFLTNKVFRTFLMASGLMIVFSMQANAQDDWTDLTTIDGVKISYQESNCDEGPALLIKMVNSSGAAISMNLDYTFSMGNSEIGGGSLGSVSLDVDEQMTSTCNEGLKIMVFEHLSMFDASIVSLQITKAE